MKKNDNPGECEVLHLDTVEKAKKLMPTEDHVLELSELFKSFANGTRVKILWALDNMEEMCVCDMAALLNMSKDAVSHQLKILRDAKLIRFRRDGKEVFYALSDDHVKQIFEKAFEHITE